MVFSRAGIDQLDLSDLPDQNRTFSMAIDNTIYLYEEKRKRKVRLDRKEEGEKVVKAQAPYPNLSAF